MQLSAVKSLHSRYYVHCNIKHRNFMIWVDKLYPSLFLINFGLARLFHDPSTYLYTPFTTNHSIVGTLLFASINSQQGYTQLCHDNLESLAYTIIYLALSDLPWTSSSAGNNKKAILQKKMSIIAEELCKGLPAPCSKFVTYICSLSFNQKSDYQYLHSILL